MMTKEEFGERMSTFRSQLKIAPPSYTETISHDPEAIFDLLHSVFENWDVFGEGAIDIPKPLDCDIKMQIAKFREDTYVIYCMTNIPCPTSIALLFVKANALYITNMEDADIVLVGPECESMFVRGFIALILPSGSVNCRATGNNS